MKHKQLLIVLVLAFLFVSSLAYVTFLVPSVHATTTTTTFSINADANDGSAWGDSSTYSTAHSTAFGSDNSGTYEELGQKKSGSNYTVNRLFLKFDTSSIPSGDTIQSARLCLYGLDDYSDTDFTICLQKWTGNTPINTGDFNSFDGTNYDDGLFSTSGYVTDDYNNITISNFALITKAGNTLICVRSSRDISSTQPTGLECIDVRTYESTTEAPLLVITYTNVVSVVITSSPTGLGYVTVDGGAITTPQTYIWTVGDSHTIAANSPANTVAGQTQYIWSNWNDSGTQSHNITVPSSATTYTASFQLQYYLTLNTATTGTTVSQSGTGWYNSGASATINATTPYLNGTTNRFIFLNWVWTQTGAAEPNSSSNPFTITMTNYASATAYWNEDSINLYSSSIAAPRVNIGTSPYINLTYRWWSDAVLVASGFTVKVNGTSRTISSGWTNFTDTSATVQTITYQLTEAEGGSYYVNSVSPSETWERVKIVSGGLSGTYTHVSTNVLANYVLEYESDNSLVTDGNVLLNGTGMTYNAGSTRWEENVTSAIIASNHYDVSAVSSNLYGITVINDAVGPVGPIQWYANLNLQTVDVDSNPLSQAIVYMNNGSGGTIPTSGPPGTGYAIVGYTGWFTQTVSAGGWANYTGMTNSSIQVYVTWYGLTVNQTFTLTYNTDTTVNLTCLAYPYTVNSIMFWTASNATITTASFTNNLLTVSFNAPLNTYTLIASCPIIPRYILNVTYNIATCYSSYLQLLHYGNATLTISYENWGDLYVQSTDQTLSSASIASGQLQIVPAGTNGIVSTLQIYCGALGNPATTTGFTTGTYGSKIYSGTYVLNGQTLTLAWSVSPFQGSEGPGITGPTISVNIALFFPSQATQGQTINGTLTVTWQSYAMIFVWQALCLQPYSGWVVNLGALPLTLQTAKTTGNVSLPIMLTVPAGTVDGSYQIPCSVTFQTPTGVSKTVGSTIALTIGPAPAPVTAASVPFILMGSFVGLFGLFIGTLFMRRNRSRKQQF